MSARNLKFPIAVGYQKQQFDPALQLERMPDISDQAAQPFKEEAAAISTQFKLDEQIAGFENFVANNLEANKERELNFLSKLAPFSNLIKQELQAFEKGWDDRRKKTADELAGKANLALRQSPEFNNITGVVNNMQASAVKQNNLGVIKDISKLDYASQAYAWESIIKNQVKNYQDNFTNWRNSVGEIEVGEGVTINPQVISTDSEAATLIKLYESQQRQMFTDAGVAPDVYESYRAQSAKSRTKVYNSLISKNREYEGEEITAQKLAALDGGGSILNTEKGIATAPKNKDRAIGYPEARTKILSHAVEGIKNFVYNYKDIERWKNEVHPITGKPLKEDPRYNSFFGRLERALNERKNADASDKEDRDKKAFDLYARQLLGKIKRNEVNLTEKLTNDMEEEVYIKMGIKNHPLFKFIREGLTVDDKKAEKLETLLKKTLDSGGYMPDQELLRFGPKLYQEYQNQNALNKKFYVDSPEIKELDTQIEAYANAPEATPGGGLGLQWDPAKKPTLGQVRLLAEAKRLGQKNYRAIAEQAGPDGTVNGKSVVDLAREKTILELEALRKNPDSIFYYNESKGEYTNVRRVSSNYGTSYTQAPTSIENMQLSRDSITALQDVARDNNTQYGAIISDENLLSQVISKEQAQQMKAQLENGRGVHPVIAGLALALGAQQVPTAAAIFNTHGLGSIEVKGAYERIAGQLADPNLQENVTLQDLMAPLTNTEAGPLQQQRLKSEALRGAAAADLNPGFERMSNVGMPKDDSAPMVSLLYGAESDSRGKWNSYNRGGAGDSPGAYPNMDRMTIGDVMRNQALPTSHPDYLFAAGGLQITEDALKEAMRYTGLSPNLPYSPQVQQHLVIFGLLANPNKRPQLAPFLLGQSNDIIGAHMDLAQEYASVAMPGTTRGYYDGDSAGNKAKIADQKTIHNALYKLRDYVMAYYRGGLI
jgi:hypothetical protein